MFSPDGNEVFWGTHRETGSIEMHCLKRAEDGTWSPKSMPSFHRQNDCSPVFAADGSRLYFLRNESDRLRMYYSDKIPDGWSDPIALPDAINSLRPSTTFSVSSGGDIYFSSEEDIYLAKQEQGQYAPASKLTSSINSDAREANPYIARDGSYLLFARMQGDFYSLMASYRNEAGSWGEPVNLGIGVAPWVTDDGKYLFYMNMKANSPEPYWIDAEVIEAAKPE